MPHTAPSMLQHLSGLRRRVPARLGAWVLLLALLVAPLLGTLHMVLHPQAVPGVAGTSQGVAAAAGSQPVASSHGLDRLFGHQAGGGDCRLFDQLCQGHALPTVPFLPPVLLPPVAVFVFLQLGHIVQREALFHARAPPTLR